MDWKQITALVTGVVIAALLLTTIVVPIIGDAVTTEKTFTNVGYYDMTYTTEDEVTAFWDHTKPHQITINGDDVELPETVPIFNLTIIAGDDWVVRYSENAISVWATSGGAIDASVSNATDMTITASNGSMTATNTASTPATKTLSYTTLYYVSEDGLYVMKDQSTPAYVLKDTPIHAIGMTYIGAPIAAPAELVFDGTVSDGITGEVYRVGEGAAVSDIALASNAVDGYIDLYTTGNITATVTNDSGSGNVTYSVYIVPASVTAELSQHLDGSSTALLSIVPLLITVGIIMAVVGVFVIRRE